MVPMGPEILLVEDEAIHRLMLQAVLADHGYRVTEAADGLSAQVLLQESAATRFSVILLDRMMPHMDGITLLTWIKSQPRLCHIPVIFQSALSEPDEIQEGMAAGALYYLTKPFPHTKVVLAMVNAAVQQATQRQTAKCKLENLSHGIKLTRHWQVNFRTIDEAEAVALLFAQVCPDHLADIISLLEILKNAVEHGNLGITFQEKTQLLNDELYDQELLRRQQDPVRGQRHVEATLQWQADGIKVFIKDQGQGFDWKPYFQFNPEFAFLPNGRGILMASSNHTLCYRGCGNSVELFFPHIQAPGACQEDRG
ncbi:response regulator receiver protein [Magnetococcus marinus MC-1]|uniref:Response regulator receiver protein n=1 Tax=Magnetococcus marinus (strain ATCC BAA-1437 / JCM 17883 / MC-1) TaxID=156889 RepID=A0LAE7_MAGMM|nr:response regulator [Magnetococcus marinus]ABK44940.1 response regulator receiver protein [Magnetococcus marinus MC-1]